MLFLGEFNLLLCPIGIHILLIPLDFRAIFLQMFLYKVIKGQFDVLLRVLTDFIFFEPFNVKNKFNIAQDFGLEEFFNYYLTRSIKLFKINTYIIHRQIFVHYLKDYFLSLMIGVLLMRFCIFHYQNGNCWILINSNMF